MSKTQFKERYYLQLIRVINSAVDKISQVLLIISNKRLTLAEKAIMSELHSCTYWDGRLVAVLAHLLREKKYVLSSIDGKMLRQINNGLVDKLQGFCNAANHSLNYLEQYFEHDLWLALSQDQGSLHLSKIVTDLELKCECNALRKC